MTSNLKVNNILPSTGTTVAVSGIASVTSSVSIANSCTATTFYGSGANLTSLPAQATISGNADNRVITGGSGVNLNGESKLTFDGDKLYVKNSSGNAGIDLNVSNNTNPRLDFNTANVASSGLIKSEESGNGAIMEFHNKNSSGNEQQVMTLTIDRNVYVNDGNLVIGTAGHGIDFSATSSNGVGELLDDYEYGSWTPTISAHLGGGSFTTNAAGRYVKVGRLVSLWGYLSWTAKGGSGVVNLNATGLPFATHNTAPNNSSVCIGSRSGWNQLRLVGQMYQTGYINVQYINSSGNSVNVNVSSLDNSGSIHYRFQYESAS